MLRFLRLKNFAIISDLEVEFTEGMNIVTGETGSGKSLMLKALELLRGARGSAELIKHGADRAEIEALFLLSPEVRQRTLTDLRENFDWVEDIFCDEEIVLRRFIDGNGRGKISINSRISTRTELEALAGVIFDITGQNSQQRLLDEEYHLACLDQFGVNKNTLADVKRDYEAWAAVNKRFESAKSSSAQRQEHIRQIQYQFEELREAGLQKGERAKLDADLKRATSVEVITSAVAEAVSLLDDESGGGVLKLLNKINALLTKLSKLDGGATDLLALGESAYVSARQLSRDLESYVSSLEVDGPALERLRDRVSEIARLERKYGKSAEELVKYYLQLCAELEDLNSGSFDLGKIEAEKAALVKILAMSEKKLTLERQEVAQRFGSAVERGLADLEMSNARFCVDILPAKSGEKGADSVKFMLAANPGENFQELGKVASGGELSRVLLVLKSLLSEVTTPVLQVFDEVDVGVGGATAEIMGERLKELSNRFQLIVVTHSPQIAAQADRHIVLSKSSTESTTNVQASMLAPEGRVREIARMLAGRDITKQFVRSAQELIGKSTRTSTAS